MIHTSKKSTKELLKEELEGNFIRSKKSIEENKSEHPTGTLGTTFHKSSGEENPFVQFGYVPQTICNHT